MFINFEPNEDTDILKKYGRNLTVEALKNKLDPVIGRDNEIRRVIEILGRRNKNNPVLIGEPGVGKTAIVEGLAQRIIMGDVPESLVDVEIIEISLSSLIAGTSFQGQFEQRVNSLIKKIVESEGKIIIFIDEVHQLIGVGKNQSNNTMGLANILKPMLARGDIKLIGATTLDEYRKFVESDSALERRLQKIIVQEPSREEAITILRGLKEKWEIFHKIKINDSALVAAVDMSTRYISDHFLPDKAIDLVDEASSHLKTQINIQPAELEITNRKIINLETELAALTKEKSDNAAARISEIKIELKDLREKQTAFSRKWNEQKELQTELNELKQNISEIQAKAEKQQSEGLYTDASKLVYIEIPKLQKKLLECENKIKKIDNNLFKTVVGENEIAEVISTKTGIPLKKLLETEKSKLINLHRYMSERVKGQEEVLRRVSNSVLRNRTNINDPNRPIGSFLFLGPTGVGKTEVAKTLAEVLFDNEKMIVRFDMSEYMEKSSVSRLIGAPPGYIGYDQAGLLSETIRQRPYSVVLFDEIEKAHPDVLNILLQILDDGQLTDNKGRLINFKNTIIIMTSNVGSLSIRNGDTEKLDEEIHKTFRPEFLNRIDDVIVFNLLTPKVIKQIVIKELDNLNARLKKQNYYLRFGDELVDDIAKNGYDPVFGARPIKRYIQRKIENLLAEKIIKNEIKQNVMYSISIDAKNLYQIKEASVLKS